MLRSGQNYKVRTKNTRQRLTSYFEDAINQENIHFLGTMTCGFNESELFKFFQRQFP